MRSLGLDPSLRSYGWAIYDSTKNGMDQIVYSGHAGTLSTTVPVTRFMHFRSIVSDLLKRFDVDVVGIESPAYGGGPFSENHFGLMMYSSEAIFEARKDFVLYDPTTLKYISTGNSKAEKSDMIKQAKLDMITTKTIQNDEIDAYFVAKAAARMKMLKIGEIGPDDLTEFEKRVFLERSKKVKTLAGTKIKRTAHMFRENSRYYSFSKIPIGDINLPSKDAINQGLLDWLEDE